MCCCPKQLTAFAGASLCPLLISALGVSPLQLKSSQGCLGRVDLLIDPEPYPVSGESSLRDAVLNPRSGRSTVVSDLCDGHRGFAPEVTAQRQAPEPQHWPHAGAC